MWGIWRRDGDCVEIAVNLFLISESIIYFIELEIADSIHNSVHSRRAVAKSPLWAAASPYAEARTHIP